MFRTLVLVSGLLLAWVASQTHGLAQGNCDNATTTAQMLACENQRYQDANSKLQAVYSQLMSSLPAERKGKLRESERAWMTFRDKNADFNASAAQGGTLEPVLRVGALADTTEERLKELSRFSKK